MDNTEILRILTDAKKTCTPIQQISLTHKKFSIKDGYAIQNMGMEIDKNNGRPLVGYKMGLTSRAKQQDVGISEPIRGFLFKDMELKPGEPLCLDKFIHPRIEPEIVVTLGADLSAAATLREIENSIQFIGIGAEIIDSRFKDFEFQLADVIADNCSAACFTTGLVNLVDRMNCIRLMGITVRKNGYIMETGVPAAVLGNPLLSILALLKLLPEEDRTLPAGSLILTGGITASIPLERNDRIEIGCIHDRIYLSVV